MVNPYTKLTSLFMKFLKKIFKTLSNACPCMDSDYLARSTDLYDLEARLRTLERRSSNDVITHR
jgi:hypothetical protein